MTRLTIVHLVAASAWAAHPGEDPWAPASLAREGFVHCTGDLETLLAVANRFYRDEPGEFLALELAVDALVAEVRWEAPRHPSGEAAAPDEPRFPHVYGPLDRHAIVAVHRARRSPDGAFIGFTRA